MLLLLLTACPKHSTPDAGDHHVLPLPAAPAICVSAVTGAGPLGPELGSWQEAVESLEAKNTAGARAALPAGEHPALGAVLAAAALLDEDYESARKLLIPLIDAYPLDACLNEAASWAYLGAGDVGLARSHARAALSANPESTNAHFLSAMVTLEQGRLDESARTLRTILSADPEHTGANLLLGAIYLAQGDELLALPLLEKAQAAGADASMYLAPTYYGAGRMDDYLRMASAAGWPLGDGGALADAEQPWQAYLVQLGVQGGGQLRVLLETSLGGVECELYYQDAPVTVANFIGLAEGTQPWTDPVTGTLQDGPMYDGTRFHRVISGFMAQGGDPLTQDPSRSADWGSGGPGYAFPDEISPRLRFDRPGRLAMANSGPGTNGSQFFITDGTAPYLDGRHTIFGQCAPLETVHALARVEKGMNDQPTEPLTLHHVHVLR